MPDTGYQRPAGPTAGKFRDPHVTASGEARAEVALGRLSTLWFNTGSLCNISCVNCYIESTPTNDRLAYLAAADVRTFLDEVAAASLPVGEIGFTGGEPFLNRELPAMLEDALGRGFRVLVLTNAMKPMWHHRDALRGLRARYGVALTLRVSLDHYEPEKHERLRGPRTWSAALDGLRWLRDEGFRLHVAGRTPWGEPEAAMRAGYSALFAAEALPVDAFDPAALVLFPEMDPAADAPEITTRCWSILGRHPDEMMCASSRMVLRRKGAARPVVVPCTLLPYDPQFELGETLGTARGVVKLNHPFCAQFCVLGGASCSSG